jgi:hypothetical protein
LLSDLEAAGLHTRGRVGTATGAGGRERR